MRSDAAASVPAEVFVARSFLALLFLAFACMTAGASKAKAQAGADGPAGFPLAGTFDVLGQRHLSGAGGTASQERPERSGRSVTFGPSLRWLDGRTCGQWGATPWKGIPFDLRDPVLSDMLIEPAEGRPNRQLMLLFAITCGEELLGFVTVIDPRVAIVSGTDDAVLTVLSAPLSGDTVSKVQDALRAGKLYSGRTTGILDDETTVSLSDYVQRRGAAFAFMRPALTANLLEGLVVLDQ